MRVGFNGFGQLGVYRAGMRALGDCTLDPESGTQICDPDPVPTGGTSAPDGGSITGCSTYDAGSDCVTCGSGYTSDGTGGCTLNPGAGYSSTPSDGVSITNCTQYDQYGNCVMCGSGYKLNTWGGTASSCDSIGGLPGTKKTAVQPSPFSSILNSLFGASAPIPNSATACAAAGGTWNGVTCTPKGTVSLGGVALSTTTLLIGGVVLLMLMKKK